ncbi:MAG: hypothetical protein O3B73_04215 [bacterium]|nr:hypothetical protein [bacterium]
MREVKVFQGWEHDGRDGIVLDIPNRFKQIQEADSFHRTRTGTMSLEIYNLMQKKAAALGWLIFLVAHTAAGADSSTDVPLAHPVYQLLDRSAARGEIRLPNMRPISRQQVAGFLTGIQGAGAELGRSEQDLLMRYIDEFAGEIGASELKTSRRPSRLQGAVFWVWQDSVASITLEPFFRQQMIAIRGSGRVEETVSQTYIGGSLRGTYRTIGFRLRHFEAREWSTVPRAARSDLLAAPVESVQLKGHSADFREGVFQMAWGNRFMRVDVGPDGEPAVGKPCARLWPAENPNGLQGRSPDSPGGIAPGSGGAV